MKSNLKNIISSAAVGLIFALLGMFTAHKLMSPAHAEDQQVQKLYQLNLKDSAGVEQKLSQWQGKIIVLNFWATWCAPCVKEMPELASLQTELASKNVQILGLGVDSPTNIAEFVKKSPVNYPLFVAGMEGTEISRQLGNQSGGLPYTVLISSNGSIAKQYLGSLDIETLRQDIQKIQ